MCRESTKNRLTSTFHDQSSQYKIMEARLLLVRYCRRSSSSGRSRSYSDSDLIRDDFAPWPWTHRYHDKISVPTFHFTASKTGTGTGTEIHPGNSKRARTFRGVVKEHWCTLVRSTHMFYFRLFLFIYHLYGSQIDHQKYFCLCH